MAKRKNYTKFKGSSSKNPTKKKSNKNVTIAIIAISALVLSIAIIIGITLGSSTQTSTDATPTATPKAQVADAGVTIVNGPNASSDLQLAKPVAGDTVAIMDTTMGVIKIKLFPSIVPKTVENFVGLSDKGYYNGTIFHRVISDFMIQGGDPQGTGTGGQSLWGGKFDDEFSDKLHNFTGAISMANSGANTNGSQFFIVQAPTSKITDSAVASSPEAIKVSYKQLGGTPWLDGKHSVFGQVYEGMDVVDKIALVQCNASDKPLVDVKINSIKIETK